MARFRLARSDPAPTRPRRAAAPRASVPASGPAPGWWNGLAARLGRSRPGARAAAPAGPRRPLALRALRWLVLLGVWGGVALALALVALAWDLPRPETALEQTRRPAVALLAADGALLATSGDLYGEMVRLRDLPPHLPAALLAVEDRRFRRHVGLDPVGLARAAVANARAGRVVQGGSTLTQQLAKNLFLTPARTFRRKGQEALLALWLERRFTKDQLLEIYLNRVYLGAGTWGVDAAARLYFSTTARRVTVGQAAILAGLPKAPSRLNPRANPQAAVTRGAEVLAAMAASGALTPERAAQEAARLRVPAPPSRDSGWFADWAQEDLAARFPGSADVVLRSTLDRPLQAAVEARLEALLAGPGARAGATQGAVVALDWATGAVRAMAGGRDYRASPFNRATSARRQPGSAFKPVVFLAAVEQGLLPDDPVSDAPLAGAWSPSNGAWRARGEITVEEALAQSVNTAAVRVLARAGGPRGAIAVARRLGLDGRMPADASIALGTGEATLLDLTAAYAPFANGGLRVEPYGVDSARLGGVAQPLVRPAPARAVATEHAQAVRRMLEATVARGTGRAAALPGRAAAGKTGTTQDFRDAWFVGIAGPLVLGVWLGNDDATPMEGVTGGGLPARLFREILEEAGTRRGTRAAG